MKHYIECDICGKKLGTYLFGNGGVEEVAIIEMKYINVNDYDYRGAVVGYKKIISNSLPDVKCFDCLKKIPGIAPNNYKF